MTSRAGRRVKEMLPAAWRARYRRLSRFRWVAKYKALRRFGLEIRQHPVVAARFILLDPEMDNFTYEIENEAEFVEHVANSLNVDPMQAAAYLWEARTDPVLRSEIEHQTKGRSGMKRMPPFGRRLPWYAMARILKPKLIVETGVQDGLASVLLLRALERNAEEGHPGRLMSFDVLPGGQLVSERFRPSWEMVVGATADTLGPALHGKEVDMIVHDSAHDAEEMEFLTALSHAAPRIALITNRAGTGTLQRLCSRLGISCDTFRERPRHFHPGTAITAVLVEREKVDLRCISA
jgi:hypothetical protein